MGKNLQNLMEIMRALRSEQGCPWDREQTHMSLRPYAIEEAYEVAEAVLSGQKEALIDELGDLLLQVVFHAVIGEEAGQFGIEDVIAAISNKMLRRHPHVFAEEEAESSQDVVDLWEEIKAQERQGQTKGALDGVTKGLPALMEANKLQSKAAKVGFDWPALDGVWDKVQEEQGEIKQALEQAQAKEKIQEEVGDLLFAVVNLARFLDIEPETALLQANNKFKTRFAYMEAEALKNHTELKQLDLEAQEELWQKAKKHLPKN